MLEESRTTIWFGNVIRSSGQPPPPPSSCTSSSSTLLDECEISQISRTHLWRLVSVQWCCVFLPAAELLKLYRVMTERCGGRVLPFGIRQLIKEYTWVTFTNETLRGAVQLWCRDRACAVRRYGDINDWDVHKVTAMTTLFQRTDFNDRIDRWDVRNVTSMDGMFAVAMEFNQPLDAWDVSQVSSMSFMFYGAKSFNQPLSSWNVSRVTSMSSMFTAASSFNHPIDAWDVRQVTLMNHLFSAASSFNQPLSSWDVSCVTSMNYMFDGATSFNQTLSTWDVSLVREMRCMFHGALSFDPSSLVAWDLHRVTDTTNMFVGTSSTPTTTTGDA